MFSDARIDHENRLARRRIDDQEAERDGLLDPDQPTETAHENYLKTIEGKSE